MELLLVKNVDVTMYDVSVIKTSFTIIIKLNIITPFTKT